MSTTTSKTKLPLSLVCAVAIDSLDLGEMEETLEDDKAGLEEKLASISSLRQRLHSVGSKLLDATFEENDLLMSLSNITDQLTAIKIRKGQYRQNYRMAKKKHSDLEKTVADLTRNEHTLKSQSENLLVTISAMKAFVEEKRKTLADNLVTHARLVNEIEKFEAKLEKAKQERQALETSLHMLRKKEVEDEAKLKKVQEAISDLFKRQPHLKMNLESSRATFERLQVTTAEMTRESEIYDLSIWSLKQKAKAIKRHTRKLKTEQHAISNRTIQEQAALSAIRRRKSFAMDNLSAVRQEVASTQSSVKALAEERDTWATPVMALSSTAKPKPDFTCLHGIMDPSSPSPPLTPPSRRCFSQRSSNRRYSLVDLHGTRARSKVLPVSPLQGAPLETPSFMSLPGSPDS